MNATIDTSAMRPGLLSKVLPGVIHELVATGDIDASTAGLAELVRELRESWWVLKQVDGRLDQQGWPLWWDVELALQACERVADLPAPMVEVRSSVRAWKEGRYDKPAQEVLRNRLFATQIGSTFRGDSISDEECLRLFAQLHPSANDSERQEFLAARRGPPMHPLVSSLVSSAIGASDGWMMYYAYRGLAPAATTQAADTIRKAQAAGLVSSLEVVTWARELVAEG